MFCKFCGNELNDGAVVCIKCGCAVEREPAPKVKKEKVASTSETSTAYKVLDFVTKTLMVLSLMFLALSIIWGGVHIWGSGYNSYGYLYSQHGLAIVSLLFAIFAYCVGVATFILGFIGSHRVSVFKNSLLFVVVSVVLALSINVMTIAW